MSERQWLANLKAGDEVAARWGWSNPTIAKVNRATATQIIVGSNRYRRKDGYLIGSTGYDRQRICEPTQEVRDQIERGRLVRFLRSTKWDALPTEALRAAAAALP